MNTLPSSLRIRPNELSRLIGELTPAEHACFLRLSESGGRSNTLVLRLLETYRKQPEASNETVCARLGIKSPAQFSTLKKRLFKALLDALLWMRRKQHISLQLSLLQEQLQLLTEGGHHKQAAKIQAEALALATRYEKYPAIISLLLLESNSLLHRDYKKYRSVDQKFFEAMDTARRCQDILNRILSIYEQVKALSYRSWLPIGTAELEQIGQLKVRLINLQKEHKSLIKKHALLSLSFHTALATCLYMGDEAKACSLCCNTLWEVWSQHPHLINEYASLFLATVNTTLYNDFRLKDIPAAHRHLEDYELLAAPELVAGVYERSLQIIIFNGRLKLHHKTARYDRVQQMLDRDGQRILSYTTASLSPPEALSVATSIAISYFVLEQWDAAETYILQVKEQNRAIDREDILYFSLVFHLLILHEKKDWYRLDSAIEAAYHFLYARKKLRIFEKELCLFLKRTITTRNQDQLQLLCQKFLLRLQEIIGKKKMPLYSAYFNFTGWLESKVRGIRYMDYVKSQSAQQSQQVEASKSA